MLLWGSETALVGPDQNRKSHDPAPHQRGWVHSPWTLTNWEVTNSLPGFHAGRSLRVASLPFFKHLPLELWAPPSSGGVRLRAGGRASKGKRKCSRCPQGLAFSAATSSTGMGEENFPPR